MELMYLSLCDECTFITERPAVLPPQPISTFSECLLLAKRSLSHFSRWLVGHAAPLVKKVFRGAESYPARIPQIGPRLHMARLISTLGAIKKSTVQLWEFCWLFCPAFYLNLRRLAVCCCRSVADRSLDKLWIALLTQASSDRGVLADVPGGKANYDFSVIFTTST